MRARTGKCLLQVVCRGVGAVGALATGGHVEQGAGEPVGCESGGGHAVRLPVVASSRCTFAYRPPLQPLQPLVVAVVAVVAVLAVVAVIATSPLGASMLRFWEPF